MTCCCDVGLLGWIFEMDKVVDYMMARIYSMQQNNEHPRSRIEVDQLTAFSDNLRILFNIRTEKILIGLFPEGSIPEKRERKNEKRTSFKQRYPQDLADKKSRMLALYLNICWGLASIDEITDEMRTFSHMEHDGPIDFIIRALFICAHRITPAGRTGVMVSDPHPPSPGELDFDELPLMDPYQYLSSEELNFTAPDIDDDDDDAIANIANILSDDQPETNSLMDLSMTVGRISPDLDSVVSSEHREIISRLDDHESQLHELSAKLESITLSQHPNNGTSLPPPASPEVTIRANPELDKFLLSDRVRSLLRERGSMKAHQIARELGKEKSVINNILYKVLKGEVHQVGPDWALNPSPAPNPLHPQIEAFLSENPDSDAQTIARSLNLTPAEINNLLYEMEAQGRVVRSQITPNTRPTWSLRSQKRMRGDL
jgi:predicted transcriptional regulator